ncbi:MAG TPA: glycoside hydrolase [Clostridiales bacterium]|nr:glycoside hydrolase [Clostridiales bacterium]
MNFGDKRDWFFERRFGMFVHWGIYAVHAYHEQETFRLGIPRAEYEPVMQEFNPVNYDPDAWLDLMEEAGMEYITFTTKHVDGFCMWDTKETDFNVMKTPCGKDTLDMLAQACHRRGIPLCLYYSCADMHHPNYPNQGRPYEHLYPQPGDRPDLSKYIDYVERQLTELCTRYGEISGIFWDANVAKHRDPSINAMIRKFQPGAVINDRGYDEGDYGTPERDYKKDQLDKIVRFEKPTETCQAIGMESWGYREGETYYSSKYMMQSIDRTLAMGGNYLLNAGPKADGTIPQECITVLRKIGDWYKRVREAFDGTAPASELITSHDMMLTRKGNTLYLHLHKDPAGNSVLLDPLAVLPIRATLLNDGRELGFRRDMGVRHWKMGMEPLRILNLPTEEFTHQVMVIKLEFDEQGALPPELLVGRPANGQNLSEGETAL